MSVRRIPFTVLVWNGDREYYQRGVLVDCALDADPRCKFQRTVSRTNVPLPANSCESLKVEIKWPAYPGHILTKEIATKRETATGQKATYAQIAHEIALLVEAYATLIQNDKTPAATGFEHLALHGSPNALNGGIDVRDVMIMAMMWDAPKRVWRVVLRPRTDNDYEALLARPEWHLRSLERSKRVRL